jgi:hypothetical protein
LPLEVCRQPINPRGAVLATDKIERALFVV